MLRKDCKNQREIRMWADYKLKQFQNRGELKTPQFRRFMAVNARYLEVIYYPDSGFFMEFKLKPCISQKTRLIFSALNKIEDELTKLNTN